MELPLLKKNQFESFCLDLLAGETQLIDVRAPVEFNAGAVPYSYNLPILTDEERALVGTTYKQTGPHAAIEKGHELVQGSVKQKRIELWIQQIEKNKRTVITCFRGGLRSRITQTWLAENNYILPRVEGGYKALRQFLRAEIENFQLHHQLLVVTGPTGVAKTKLLREISQARPILDLELAAIHRGSAFGAFEQIQPSQVNFENQLALQMIKTKTQSKGSVLIEDESRLIGKCVQPESLFLQLRQSPVVFIDEPIEKRIENTFEEYILRPSQQNMNDPNKMDFLFEKLQKSLDKISNKLGGLRHTEIKKDMQSCQQQFKNHHNLDCNKIWIQKLLLWYYDPIYLSSLKKRNPTIYYRGNYQQTLAFLKQN